MKTSIYIVMATCNGADYLAEQLDSLISQTVSKWTLLIRDDQSTDRTLEIITRYAEMDERIRVIHCEETSGSALANFSVLLSTAYERGAEIIFCCDQDDVWEPNKLESIVPRILEIAADPAVPALVHHDLAVVNESLEPVAGSFIEMMQLQPSGQQNPQRLLSRNEVTGCAMACNRSLLEIALPISDQAIMHDWWLALCAGYFGKLAFVPEKLVKYRQHGRNTIGAKSFWHGLNPFTNWIAGWRRGDEEFIETVIQAIAFREAMSERLKPEPAAAASLDLYTGLVAATRRERLKALRQLRPWRSHWLLNVVLVLRMLLLPRSDEL